MAQTSWHTDMATLWLNRPNSMKIAMQKFTYKLGRNFVVQSTLFSVLIQSSRGHVSTCQDSDVCAWWTDCRTVDTVTTGQWTDCRAVDTLTTGHLGDTAIKTYSYIILGQLRLGVVYCYFRWLDVIYILLYIFYIFLYITITQWHQL